MIFRSENKQEVFFALFLAGAGILLRLLPHPDNFTPVMAIALFSGVVLSPSLALTIPLVVMIASDMLIGPHDLFLLTWGSFFVAGLIGLWVRKNPGISRIAFGTLCGSILFFVVTNFGVFVFQNMYPKTASGLTECFMMALPFFRNSLLGDFFFAAVFFGVFAFAKHFSRTICRMSA